MSDDFSWRTGRSCVYKNFVHLVFVTKYRRNVLTEEMLSRLSELFSETCDQMDAELIEFSGEDDHVHLMLSCPPKLAVASLVGKLKGKSSYFLRREFWSEIEPKLWKNHFWSPSYCVVSCGGTPLNIVKEYISNQRKPPSAKQQNQSRLFTGRNRDEHKNWI